MEHFSGETKAFKVDRLQIILVAKIYISTRRNCSSLGCLKWMLLKRGTGSGERGAGNGERKSGNELSAEASTKIQNGGPKHEREKEEDKERNSCLG